MVRRSVRALAVVALVGCSSSAGYCDERSKCEHEYRPVGTVTLEIDGAHYRKGGTWLVGTVPDGDDCVGGPFLDVSGEASVHALTVPTLDPGTRVVPVEGASGLRVHVHEVFGTFVLEHWRDRDVRFAVDEAAVCVDDGCRPAEVAITIEGDWEDLGQVDASDDVAWTLEDGTPLCTPQLTD